MCGICGIGRADGREVEPELLDSMIASLNHRGPDASGRFRADGIGLGIRRLSIIDLERGDQPIFNERRDICIVCNGEIYNHEELRRGLSARGHVFQTRSDVEVIVHLYEEHGTDCLRFLRGMFGFALWDGPGRRLMLARDRFGIKPLYLYESSGTLLFGSEIKALLASNEVSPSLNPDAVKSFLHFGFTAGPQTFLAQVRKVPAGYYCLWQAGHLSSYRYWDLNFPAAGNSVSRSSGAWAGLVYEKLQESVRLHLSSDVEVGAWLSSGLDSSSVVQIMIDLLQRPIQTFSLGFDQPQFSEIDGASTLAQFRSGRIQEHRGACRQEDFALLPKAVWHCEDLSNSGIEIPRMRLSEETASYTKVVLTGEGADEVFGGYNWYRKENVRSSIYHLPSWMRRFLAIWPAARRHFPELGRESTLSQMTLGRFACTINRSPWEELLPVMTPEFSDLLSTADATRDVLPLPEDFSRWHPIHQLQYVDVKIRLADFVVQNLDRPSMAYSIEARVPFLDHELVELCSGIPPGLNFGWMGEKRILRMALHGRLPKAIGNRRKRGLAAPRDSWFRAPLPEFAAHLLSAESVADAGFFKPQAVARLLDDQRNGMGEQYGKHLMSILVLQMWHHTFLKRTGKSSVRRSNSCANLR